MGRHELREQVFLSLFCAEFHEKEEMPRQISLFIENSEIAMDESDESFIEDRVQSIVEHMPEIDKLITENTEGWTIDRMGKVELTAMRLAVYEMKYDEAIPDGVAIDEAVEITKKYGQKNSGGFVNAILAKIVKLGE